MAEEALDPLDSFVEMGAPHAQRHIVSGVEHDAKTGEWRAQSGAALRFLTLPLDELRFGLKFDLPPEIFTQYRTLRLRVSLNSQPFVEKAFDTPGPHSIDEPVAKGFVSWDRETQVEIIIESPAGRPIQQPALQILSVGFRP